MVNNVLRSSNNVTPVSSHRQLSYFKSNRNILHHLLYLSYCITQWRDYATTILCAWLIKSPATKLSLSLWNQSTRSSLFPGANHSSLIHEQCQTFWINRFKISHQCHRYVVILALKSVHQLVPLLRCCVAINSDEAHLATLHKQDARAFNAWTHQSVAW